jgi:predicted double-glycine peptidase
MIGVVIWGSVLPFFMPVLLRENLASLQTKMDADNVCVQSTNYTCGPAAAVTALRRLGLTAQEGEIAILSHSSPIAGTLPWCLYKAIQNRYASEGLDCQFRRFDSVSQLREADVTLVVVKDAFLLDHCVAVIEVGDETVTIADPVRGQTKMSYKDFEDVWRFYGIALKSGTTHKG